MTSRRQFLQQSLLAATGCVAHVMLNASCAPRRQRAMWTAPVDPVIMTAPFARLEAVGPDAWALISTPLGGDRTTFANGGIIAGRTGVVVIEGLYRTAGAAWLAQQARALTGRWPTHVVLTHYHVDHASGVNGYAPVGSADRVPRVHATAVTRELALSGAPVAPARDAGIERPFADMVVVPDQAPSRLDLGDRMLSLVPFSGHTRSDLAVHHDDAALTWAGDLVWYRMFPNYVDAAPPALHASVRALAERLRSPRARLIPGHGAHIDSAGLREYLDLLEHVEAAARAAHGAGTPASQAAAAYRVPSTLGEWMASRPSVERAMTAWYRALDRPSS